MIHKRQIASDLAIDGSLKITLKRTIHVGHEIEYNFLTKNG
jgi:hypothetical protein